MQLPAMDKESESGGQKNSKHNPLSNAHGRADGLFMLR